MKRPDIDGLYQKATQQGSLSYSDVAVLVGYIRHLENVIWAVKAALGEDGRRLAELRKEKGWSQYRLAKESGIQQGTISNLELGKRQYPQADTLKRLCDALGVSMAEFDDKKTAQQQAVEELISHRPPAQTEEEARYYAIFDALPWEEKEKRLLRFVRSATVHNGKVSYELLAEKELKDILEKLSRLSPEARKRLSSFLDSVIPHK